MRNLLIVLCCVAFSGCIRYSFTGSTLPSHIKTVSIPLVENTTAEIGIEEKLRDQVYNAYTGLNVLSVVQDNGDADLRIRVIVYANVPDEYDASGNVKTYKVTITAQVAFVDTKENKAIFEDTITGSGIYDHRTENVDTGIGIALGMLKESIINNTVSGW